MTELDLHQLRAFVAVSRHGSVARAADALRMTASPVSRTVRELERSTGPLFERGYHDMRLTEQGHRLLPMAVTVVRHADDLLLVARGEEPPLRWSATPWVPDRFADAIRAALSADSRAAEVDGAVSATLLQRMRHGEIDLAVVHLPVTTPGIGSAPIARYRFALVVDGSDPLAARTAITQEDLRGRRVLLLPLSMQPEAMSRIDAWVRAAGAGSVHEIELADVPLLGHRLRREEAVTLGTYSDAAPLLSGPQTTRIPFADEPIDFRLGLAWRSDDPVRADRIRRVVAAVRHEEGALPLIT